MKKYDHQGKYRVKWEKDKSKICFNNKALRKPTLILHHNQ